MSRTVLLLVLKQATLNHLHACSGKSISQCSHSPRWNRLYLADIGDATYSSSDTEESQWRLGFIGWRRGSGVQSSSPLTWSAPVRRRTQRKEIQVKRLQRVKMKLWEMELKIQCNRYNSGEKNKNKQTSSFPAIVEKTLVRFHTACLNKVTLECQFQRLYLS